MRTKEQIIKEFKKASILYAPTRSLNYAHEALQKRQELIMEMLLVLSKEILETKRMVIDWSGS